VGPQEPPPDEEHPPQLFAIREMSFSTSAEPHEGHAISWPALMTSSSKSLPHFPHSYSNMGIASTSWSRRPCSSRRPCRARSSRIGPRSRTSATFRSARRAGGGRASSQRTTRRGISKP